MASRPPKLEVQVLEANDCGFLRHVEHTQSGRLILQRAYKLPCYELTVKFNIDMNRK